MFIHRWGHLFFSFKLARRAQHFWYFIFKTIGLSLVLSHKHILHERRQNSELWVDSDRTIEPEELTGR